MLLGHGKTWKQNLPVEINLTLINPQAIVPDLDSGANSEDLDAVEAADVATVTTGDAEEDRPSTRSPQSEPRPWADAESAGANPPQELVEEEEPENAIQASGIEARPEALEEDAEAGIEVGAQDEEEEEERAGVDLGLEAPAPEIEDPEHPTQKLPLWILEANVKMPLKLRVNWVSRAVLVVPVITGIFPGFEIV